MPDDMATFAARSKSSQSTLHHMSQLACTLVKPAVSSNSLASVSLSLSPLCRRPSRCSSFPRHLLFRCCSLWEPVRRPLPVSMCTWFSGILLQPAQEVASEAGLGVMLLIACISVWHCACRVALCASAAGSRVSSGCYILVSLMLELGDPRGGFGVLGFLLMSFGFLGECDALHALFRMRCVLWRFLGLGNSGSWFCRRWAEVLKGCTFDARCWTQGRIFLSHWNRMRVCVSHWG